MRTSQTAIILSFLEKRVGKKTSIKEIERELVTRASGTRSRKDSYGRNRTPIRSRERQRNRSISPHEIDEIVQELCAMDMIQKQGNDLFPQAPFLLEATISLNAKGNAYAIVLGPKGRGSLDIFISSKSLNGVLPKDKIKVRLKDRFRNRFEGEVVSIVNRFRKEYRMKLLEFAGPQVFGTILDTRPAVLTAFLNRKELPSKTKIISDKQEAPTIAIVALTGDRVYIDRKWMYRAELIRMESFDTKEDPDWTRILMKYGLEEDYPSLVIQEITKDSSLLYKKNPCKEHVSDWEKRQDLRKLYTITIDGTYSKDFDDALSLIQSTKDRAKLYVHIADVSHYVPMDSELDREAKKRSLSHYLSNYTIPMLPSTLSEELCSLKAGENRLAVTVEMDINLANGRILKSWFYRSIIKVNRRFTYEEAERILDQSLEKNKENTTKGNQYSPFSVPLQEPTDSGFIPSFFGYLWEIAKKQKQRRILSGRMDISLSEPDIHFDKKSRIKFISYKDRLKSSMLIEECMLSANISTAFFLFQKKVPVLYRVHEPMEYSRLDDLNSFCSTCKIPVSLPDSSSLSVQKALATVQEHSSGNRMKDLFQIILLRSLSQAFYTPKQVGHWGLGFTHYCHFTSPIRRYPDLINHRLLTSVVEGKKIPYTLKDLKRLGILTSESEKKAIESERDMQKLKLVRYIIEKRMNSFRGILYSIRPERLVFQISELPIEVEVPADSLTRSSDESLNLENPFSVFIPKMGREIFVGDERLLYLEDANLEKISVSCRLNFDEKF